MMESSKGRGAWPNGLQRKHSRQYSYTETNCSMGAGKGKNKQTEHHKSTVSTETKTHMEKVLLQAIYFCNTDFINVVMHVNAICFLCHLLEEVRGKEKIHHHVILPNTSSVWEVMG